MCPPDENVIQRDFDSKLEKDMGFTYIGTTTDTGIDDVCIDYWCKVFSNKILNIGIDGIYALR